jgi:hypothetical protein
MVQRAHFEERRLTNSNGINGTMNMTNNMRSTIFHSAPKLGDAASVQSCGKAWVEGNWRSGLHPMVFSHGRSKRPLAVVYHMTPFFKATYDIKNHLFSLLLAGKCMFDG